MNIWIHNIITFNCGAGDAYYCVFVFGYNLLYIDNIIIFYTVDDK